MDGKIFEPGLGLAPSLDGDILVQEQKPPLPHTHPISEVTSLQAALDALQGGINGKANASHTHTIGEVGGLQAVLDTKLNKTGDTLTGNLWFGKGHLQSDGDIFAVRADGNTGVIYLGGSASRYLYYDGSRYHLPGAPLTLSSLDVSGRITAADVVTSGPLYAANGGVYLNTDGNVYGPRWGAWTGAAAAWAFDAIDARIERRAEDWARAVGNGYISRDRVTSAGFVGGDANQPYMMYDGWSIEVLVSNRNMGYRIGSMGHGSIGTYALATSVNTRSPGDVENGANLRYSTGGGSTPNASIGGGSWRCMSYSTTTFPGIWLRYA